MKKLYTEKSIAKIAVRIGDRSHDLAQTYIKLTPKYRTYQKAYEVAERRYDALTDAQRELSGDNIYKTWPDMMKDLTADIEIAENEFHELGDKVFMLECKLEEIDGALYAADLEINFSDF